MGRNAHPVSQMADELGVCRATVMSAVREHGEPLVDDPGRVVLVSALGVDETSWLTATKDHSTLYATGLVDLQAKVVIDVIEGSTARDLGAWIDRQPVSWLNGIGVVRTDLAESYRSGLSGRLDHVSEIGSLGRTLARWRTEILSHHRTGASNAPTEGLNLLITKVKRAGHGLPSRANHRLRILLHTGGVNWPATRPPAPRIRTRSPHSDT